MPGGPFTWGARGRAFASPVAAGAMHADREVHEAAGAPHPRRKYISPLRLVASDIRSYWPINAGPGFYAVELPPEELVHNLEHGQIVIWYAPNIARGTQTSLERLVALHSFCFSGVSLR